MQSRDSGNHGIPERHDDESGGRNGHCRKRENFQASL